MHPYSRLLVDRIRQLGETAVFTQFEEIGVMQYVSDAPRHIPAIVSPHNVDSAVAGEAAGHMRGHFTRARATYRARRLLSTERRAAGRADLFICVTEHDREHFIRNGARRVAVIPNGVDDDLLTLPQDPVTEPRVLFFGSYVWQPNAEGLVRYIRDVWPRVVRELPAAELCVAGPGPLGAIRDAASSTRQVTILGFVPDLIPELASARLVVAPIWSGGGTRIKVLEAMAAARPVVGTTLAVERIGFEHDRHGLVADDPESMAAATLRVLRDQAAAQRYAANGRALAEKYRWRTVTAPLEELYRGFVERQRSATTQTIMTPDGVRAF